MKARLFVLFAGAMFTASSLNAQGISSQCPSGTTAQRVSQDACQKAVDLFQYMAPQLGTSITGGNATLGQGGSLGGLGHFSVGLRINAVQGSLPQVQDASVRPVVTGMQQSQYDTKNQILPMPTADLAVGVFKGLPLAITNVGGV